MDYTHGGDIYTYEGMLDFSVNINPFGPSQMVLDAAAKGIAACGVYPDSQCRRLKHMLAERLGISEDMLIAGNGAADLIFSLAFAIRPKRALLTAPSFSEYAQALRAADCELVCHFLREEEGFRLTERILRQIDEGIDILFLCAPDNPTGQTIERELLDRIVERCKECAVRLVLDQCFYEFMESPEEALSGIEVQEKPWVFLLRAFTKIHAMPGLRLGYGICADKELMERVQSVRQPWSVSGPAQAAGEAALLEEDRMKQTREYVASERRWMEDRLRESGVTYYPSAANYILLKSEYDLFTLLKHQKILIRDCANYEGLKRGFYRIAVRKHEENSRLIAAVEEIYKKER